MRARIALACVTLAYITWSNAMAQQPSVEEQRSVLTREYPGVDVMLGCRDNGPVCIINKPNGGGAVWKFEQAADEVLSDAKTAVIIDTDCYSACAIFADEAREKVYITKRARFFFHKTFMTQTEQVSGITQVIRTDFQDPPRSADIDRWVHLKNPAGYPIDGFVEMTNEEAAVFWSMIMLEVPLPRPRPHFYGRMFNAHSIY
jgi:hypothetical protein